MWIPFFIFHISNHIFRSSTQICVVHQIRYSCKYVIYKDKKEFATDMKIIYNTPNKEVAATELDNLEKKWGGKYPYAILSWRNNWRKSGCFLPVPAGNQKNNLYYKSH